MTSLSIVTRAIRILALLKMLWVKVKSPSQRESMGWLSSCAITLEYNYVLKGNMHKIKAQPTPNLVDSGISFHSFFLHCCCGGLCWRSKVEVLSQLLNCSFSSHHFLKSIAWVCAPVFLTWFYLVWDHFSLVLRNNI